METLAAGKKEKGADIEPVDELSLSKNLRNIYKNREVQFLPTKQDEKHKEEEDEPVMDFEEALQV